MKVTNAWIFPKPNQVLIASSQSGRSFCTSGHWMGRHSQWSCNCLWNLTTRPELKDLLHLWVWKMLLPLNPHQKIHADFLQQTFSQFWTLGLSCHHATLVGGNSDGSGHERYLAEDEKHHHESAHFHKSVGSPKEQGFLWSVRCFSSWFAFLSLCDLCKSFTKTPRPQNSHVWSERVGLVL